jgi:hypothetical protein
MKHIILILLTIILFSCTKNVLQTGPSCIQEKINIFKTLPKGNPPRSIIEYTYKGKKVFYVPAQCCDQFSDLFDESCNLLGHPDGGITGKGDGKFPDFSTEAKDPKVIWKDDR